jgi:tetratricopeptide (TPR) repeat protein
MRHGQLAEAIPLLREAIELFRAARPETEFAIQCANLGNCLDMVGQLEEADRLLRESLERATERLRPDHQDTDWLRWFQARVWIDQGEVERAVALGREALVLRKRIYPVGHHMIAAALMDLGRGFVLLGEFAEAEAVLAESLSSFAKSSPFLPHYRAWAECWYGASLAGRRRYAAAEPHLLAAEKGLREARTTPPRHYRQAVEQLIKLYESSGRSEQATRWRKELTASGDSQGPSSSKEGGANSSER